MTGYPTLYRHAEARGLISQIQADRDDDTVRLVFADWVEEHAADDPAFSDHYSARVEFIRLGCQAVGRSLARINRREGAWLKANWPRLLPVTLSQHQYIPAADNVPLRRTIVGRVVPLRIDPPAAVEVDVEGNHIFSTRWSVDLHMRRGFVERREYRYTLINNWSVMAPALAKDDPLFPCRLCDGLPRLIRRERDGVWVQHVTPRDTGNREIFDQLLPTVRSDDGDAAFASYVGPLPAEVAAAAREDLDFASRAWTETARLAYYPSASPSFTVLPDLP